MLSIINSKNAFKRNQVRSSGNWLPGSLTPSYLDSLPASYGFDPLGLGSTPSNLSRFQEAELIHCRWAMLGVTGSLAVEALGFGNWYDAPLAAKQTYFGFEMPFSISALVVIEIVLMAAVEGQRFNINEETLKLYPGFDFVGLCKVNIGINVGLFGFNLVSNTIFLFLL